MQKTLKQTENLLHKVIHVSFRRKLSILLEVFTKSHYFRTSKPLYNPNGSHGLSKQWRESTNSGHRHRRFATRLASRSIAADRSFFASHNTSRASPTDKCRCCAIPRRAKGHRSRHRDCQLWCRYTYVRPVCFFLRRLNSRSCV